MAGTRVEKIGTVFTRVTGLLKSGALKEADKPVWYEVYKAFPPTTEQRYGRPVDPIPPIDIVYREDPIRAKFNAKYKHFEFTDLANIRKSVMTRFIEYYTEIKASGEEDEEMIFNKAVAKLRQDGVRLETMDEARQVQALREEHARKTRETTAKSVEAGKANELSDSITQGESKELMDALERIIGDMHDDEVHKHTMQGDNVESVENSFINRTLESDTKLRSKLSKEMIDEIVLADSFKENLSGEHLVRDKSDEKLGDSTSESAKESATKDKNER